MTALDRGSTIGTLLRIVLRLSKAVIAVVGLFSAVAYWNRFFEAVVYFTDLGKGPIGAARRQYVAQVAPQSIQMAVVVLATLPIVTVYPFVQRYFVKGVLTGAVKS